MRKRYRVLLLAAIVAAFVVPVGFALSLDSGPVQPSRMSHLSSTAVATTVATTASAVTSAVVIAAPAPGAASSASIRHVPDAMKLLLVGTGLFGLAAAVRKVI